MLFLTVIVIVFSLLVISLGRYLLEVSLVMEM